MKVWISVTLLLGIAGTGWSQIDFTFDCSSNAVAITLREAYLNTFVTLPVRSVFFIKPGDDLHTIITTGSPSSPCSTTDTGDYLAATFDSFQECAYSTVQTGGTITFQYKGMLITTNNGVVDRDSRHFFTFECVYADTYDLTAVPFQPYLANFFSSDSASATLTPTLSLWSDSGFSVPLPTDRGIPTTDTVYVQIESHNIFLIEVVKCASSPSDTLGFVSETVLIVNDMAMSGAAIIQQDMSVFKFSFPPQFGHFQNLYVVCEVQICDTVASGATCLVRRKRSVSVKLVKDDNERKTYILSTSYSVEPSPDQSQESNQIAPADVVPRNEQVDAEEVEENTNPISETIQNSNPISETIQDTNPQSETIQDTNPVSETIEDTNPQSETIQNSNLVSETIQDTNPQSETIQNSNPLSETIQDTNPQSETIQDTNPQSETIQDTNPQSEIIQNTNPQSETIQDTNLVSETIQDINQESETIQDTNPESETTTTTKAATTTETTTKSTTTETTTTRKRPSQVVNHTPKKTTNGNNGASVISRPHGNTSGDVKHASDDVMSRFVTYVTQAEMVFYLAIGLLVLMVIVMMVATYKRCVGKKKVARVGENVWGKN